MKYIYLEESKLLYDNILDKECKIKYMKKTLEIILYTLFVVNLQVLKH